MLPFSQNTKHHQMAVWRFLFANTVFFCSVCVFAAFSRGKLSFTAPRDTGFSLPRAITHEVSLSSGVRVPGSIAYEYAIKYIVSAFQAITDEPVKVSSWKDRKVLSFETVPVVPSFTSDSGVNVLEMSGSHLLFKISSKYPMQDNPLMVVMKLDTGTEGLDHYESTLYCAAAIEAARVVFTDPSLVLYRQVWFLFATGGLDIEKVLSRYVMENFTTGSVLYLNSIGPGRPWTMLERSWRSSSMVRALAEIPGMVMYSGIAKLFGWKGALVKNGCAVKMGFMGNPLQHHTRMDAQQTSNDDLLYVGNAIMSFLRRYNPDGKEKPIFAFGISPLLIVVRQTLWKKVVRVIIGIAMLCLVVVQFRKMATWISMFKRLLLHVVILGVIVLVWCIFGYALSVVNPTSYGFASFIWGALLVLCLECFVVYLAGTCSFVNGFEWRMVHVLCLTVLLVAFRNEDESLPLVLTLVLQLVLLLISRWVSIPMVVEFVLLYLSSLPFTVIFSMVLGPLCFQSMLEPSLLSDFVSLLLVMCYALNMALSVMPWCLSQMKSKDFRWIGVLPLVISLVFLVRPVPFSKEAFVPGTLTQFVYDSSNDSVITFVPFAGNKVAHAVYTATQNWTYEPSCRSNWLIRSSTPCFSMVKQSPNMAQALTLGEDYNVTTRVGNSEARRLKVSFGNRSQKLSNHVMLAIHCSGRQACIRKWSGGIRPSYIRTQRSKWTALFSVTGPKTSFTFEAEFNGGAPIPVDIMFVMNQKSSELRRVIESFKSKIQHSPDLFELGGSIVIHTLHV